MPSGSSSSSSFRSSDSENPNPRSQVRQMVHNWVMAMPLCNEIVAETVTELTRRGSTFPNRPRDRVAGHNRLFLDYFAENPIYTDDQFRRRFIMRRSLFLHIVGRVQQRDPWFQQKYDAVGKPGFSPLQKCTAAMRLLAYGVAADQIDEYVRISEKSSLNALCRFVDVIIAEFQDVCLRKPNQDDLRRLLHIGEVHGFPGMLGSIDCMHWEWKYCPTAWQGQFQGRDGKATIILEAVASADLWIWHAFFGVPGSSNDINVLNRSPVFNDIFEGRAPLVNFEVNGHQNNMGYYLSDGIYPEWATFVQAYRLPQGPKAKLFSQRQESARKDVERAFGVLQARFAIIRNPALIWKTEVVQKIMIACIMLHNMIVEDERQGYLHNEEYGDFSQFDQAQDDGDSPTNYNIRWRADMQSYLRNRMRVRNRETYNQLRDDLTEHIWDWFGHGGVE